MVRIKDCSRLIKPSIYNYATIVFNLSQKQKNKNNSNMFFFSFVFKTQNLFFFFNFNNNSKKIAIQTSFFFLSF